MDNGDNRKLLTQLLFSNESLSIRDVVKSTIIRYLI